jgi:uncharacterized protein (TIGR03435 family)
MQELDDIALLRQYVEHNSDEAFAALVSRHVNKVYSVALRHTRNPHSAEEITQAVFVILAKKSAHISRKVILSGWLYQTARLTALTHIRGEIRRAHREQEAHVQTVLNEPESDPWPQIAPFLDAAMAGLNERDRHAVVLRFFDGKSMKEVGVALGTGEDAAKMRVNRAVEKLRHYFARRGIAVSAGLMTAAITGNSVQAAPSVLAKSISAVAVARGAASSGSTLTLVKGAMKVMAWTKMKTAIVVGVGALLIAGTTTVTVQEIQAHQTYPWQVDQGGLSDLQLNQPPQVRILPSQVREPDWAVLSGKLIGLGVPAQNVVASAYGFLTPTRADFTAELPPGKYDYIACLPGGEDANEKALQAEVKRKFGVVGKIETRDSDVWLLKLKSVATPGLKPNVKDYGNALHTTANGFQGWNESMPILAHLLEDMAGVPIIDQTGLTNRFDFDLNCTKNDLSNHNWENVNEALGRLGLELTPARQPIEVLVVARAKN